MLRRWRRSAEPRLVDTFPPRPRQPNSDAPEPATGRGIAGSGTLLEPRIARHAQVGLRNYAPTDDGRAM